MRPGHSTTLHISPPKGYYRTSYVGHVRRMDASPPQVGVRGGETRPAETLRAAFARPADVVPPKMDG